MIRSHASLILTVLFTVNFSGTAEAKWTFELLSGPVYNFTTPLIIRQSGYEHIKLNATYETRPFQFPLYYVLRAARWRKNWAWELEFIHHKLYLKNNPPQVQSFTITHGYNLVTINWARLHKRFVLRIGAGIVITHPETTIRKKKHPENRGIFNKGYYISGPTIQIAFSKKFLFGKKLFCTIEAKLNSSYTRIPIQNGNANLVNAAVHGLFGLGYYF